MSRKKVNKSLYIVMICLLAVICAIPAVSAFFTDHAVLSAQIKTGTWNYSLAIDPKGGTWNGTTSATLMENLEAGQTVAIADPVRTGYTFTNWTLSAGSAGKFDSAKKIYTAAPGSKDTLGANWRANTYKIAFNGNGADGGSMPAQSLTYDAKSALSANAFTRTGYSFSGWNTSADGKGTTYADKAQVSNLSTKDGDTVQLYAQWSAITYHIAYDLNGGTAAGDNPATYTVESGAITLTAPMRTGYTFTGWTGANGTTPQTTVTIPSGSAGDRTYTANWKANTDTKYKVIHQQEQLDGSYKTIDTQNLTGTTDSKVTPAVKAYTGFTAPTAQTVTIAGAGTTTITYKYSRNSYTITRQYRLENADGSFASYQRIDSKSYKYGASVPTWNRVADTTYKAATIATYTVGAKNDTLSVSVMRNTSTNNIIQYRLQNADGSYPSDYTSGWSGTLRYGESYTWAYNQTASHQAVSKSVSYNAGTAKVDVPRRTGRLVIHANGGNSDRTTTPIIYGSATDHIDPMPTRTGYTLAGLYTAASGGTKVVDASGSPANDGTYSKSGAWLLNSDVPVYAQWKANSYTVTYNGNGASSGAMASQAATYNANFITAKNAFAKDGYWFAGWNERADGTGIVWSLGSNGVAEYGHPWVWTYDHDVTLYAQWTPYKYTVSFNANGGAGTTASVTATYGSALPSVTNGMSRTGYTFAGFYDAAIGGTQYYSASNAAVKAWDKAASATLYAHWTLTPYKFDVNPQAHVTGFRLKKNDADADGGKAITDYYADAHMGDKFVVYSPTFASGYTFSGYTNQGGPGTQTVSGTNATVTMGAGAQSIAIAAKPITYSISYTLNGGSITGQPTSYTVESAELTLPTPTRTGYTFAGWTGSNGTTAQTAVTIATGSTGNKSYVANWKANTNTKYTVVHQQEQLDGTYKTVETQNLTGTTDAKVTPAVKSYTGFKAPTAQTITIAANGTASVTYKYMRNSYTVTRQYRLENADGSFSAYTRIDSKSYKYGSTVAAWSRAADATYKAASIGAYTVGAKNDTLSVNVMRNTSTNNVIRYRLQNADGSYPSTYTTGWSGTLRYGQSHTWSLAQNTSHAAASKTVAYNGGTVSVDVPRRTGRLVINANGGSFSGSSSRTTSAIRYGSTGDNVSPMPTRTGYTLNGLYTAATGGTKVVNADGTKANDGTYSKSGAWQLNWDVPVYAQWTVNKYTVTLSKGQGIDSVSGAGTYTYGQTVTINATVNSNYNWSQWNVLSGTVSGTLTNQKLTFTMPAGNVSLRAGDAIGSDAHRKTYVITYHANLHDGQKLQDSDGTGSTDTHISSVPSGAVKGTSNGVEVYQQTIYAGGGSKALANGFSWDAVKAAAAKVLSTLFDTNWDE